MPLFLLLMAGALLVTPAQAQERWRRLPGAAAAFAVDLQSLALDRGVLRAKVRTQEVANRIVVEELEVRCSAARLRTVGERLYDRDTGRPLPAQPEPPRRDAAWAESTEHSNV